ncbi:hypothetical protein CQW23_24920 [Capsicum baccatum]|uniref:Glycosyltransferase N-terminal domain-containing protein n=1 Tax=Capsicum baccatum TaxID=33114 RepID=A0A2G2VW58_CAPBA|nr:hypothetical protein CQW23_24920 [Capsicum baccatum]
MMNWVVQDVPAVLNAECYCFNSISAFHMYLLFWEIKGKPFQAESELYEDIPSLESCCSPEIWELWRKEESLMGKVSSGKLYNSSRVIEGLYLDLVAKENDGLNVWALGPFNPLLSEQNQDSNKHHQALYWLDKQETNSVIYEQLLPYLIFLLHFSTRSNLIFLAQLFSFGDFSVFLTVAKPVVSLRVFKI